MLPFSALETLYVNLLCHSHIQRSHATNTSLTHRLQSSFHAHIKANTQAFQFCPTPDCPSLYHPTPINSPSIFTCTSCLTSICTSCNVISWVLPFYSRHEPSQESHPLSKRTKTLIKVLRTQNRRISFRTCKLTSRFLYRHDGITCSDWQEYYADGGTQAFKKYKQEHDVRDCPSCKAGIEKIDGCMHMRCEVCEVHICWYVQSVSLRVLILSIFFIAPKTKSIFQLLDIERIGA